MAQGRALGRTLVMATVSHEEESSIYKDRVGKTGTEICEN